METKQPKNIGDLKKKVVAEIANLSILLNMMPRWIGSLNELWSMPILVEYTTNGARPFLKPDILMLPIGGLGNNIWTMDTADGEMFKREVEKMGIKCSIMKYGDEINV